MEHLEAMKPTDTDNIGWVFKTMLEIGVGVGDLLGLYEKYVFQLSLTSTSLQNNYFYDLNI